MKKDRILKQFEDFVAIQSVSTDPSRSSYMLEAADFLQNDLKELGFLVKKLQKGDAPPLVFAKRTTKGAEKTIAIYGHYDVQPEDPVDEWTYDPFSLIQENGKFYGRGTSDNKGHVIQNLAALRTLIESNNLQHNVICIFEGEEEVGSDNLENYLQELEPELKDVDVFYVTDVGMYQKNIPQIYYAMRGLVYFNVNITTGTHDLHSGIYGNKVHNPGQVIGDLIHALKDMSTNRVRIPGFYDDVRDIPQEELDLLSGISKDPAKEKEEAGVQKLISIDNLDPYLSTKIAPSLDINGIITGYTGEGAKTVIPYTGTLKFSCRLVENQDPQKIADLVKKYIETSLPDGVQSEITVHSADAPFYTELDNIHVKEAARKLKETFGQDAKFNRSGGTIPITEMIQRLFKAPVILTGFVLPDCGMHAPDENYDEDMFWKGIEALTLLYS